MVMAGPNTNTNIVIPAIGRSWRQVEYFKGYPTASGADPGMFIPDPELNIFHSGS
jgi:hypothetical protein